MKNLELCRLRNKLSLLLVIMVVTLNLHDAIGAPQLNVDYKISPKPGEKEGTVSVMITGRVMDAFNNPIQGAGVSLQLADASKTSLHTSLVYSKGDGSYLENITIAKPMSGNYTLYLTASKVGYDDRKLTIPFSLISGDFSLKITPTSRSLKQGSNTSFEIAMVSLLGENLPQISIRIIGLPQRVTYDLINKSATAPKILILNLITRADTPVGKYNFTIIGESKGYSHITWAIVEVTEADKLTGEPTPRTSEPTKVAGEPQIPAWWLSVTILVVLGASAAVVLFNVFRTYLARSEDKEFKLEPSHDKDYLAIARALARLEELRAAEKLDEDTYEKLKQEYEEKLEKARKKA